MAREQSVGDAPRRMESPGTHRDLGWQQLPLGVRSSSAVVLVLSHPQLKL